MGNIIDNIKQRFKQKDVLIQLIIINISIFLILSVIGIITTLFKLHGIGILGYISVPSNLEILPKRFWTVFTYMFVHKEFLHIFFNMLLLYWFGQIFLTYFSQKNLGSLYILGGLAGAALYILAFNTIPYYIEMDYPPMIGASASVTAIIAAAAFYNPRLEISLLLFGRIKIIYIVLFILVIDIISLVDQSNSGGHVAHIGGAIIGYVYARLYLKGKDITRWMSRILDFITNLFKPKPPKMKVKYKKAETDYEYNERKRKESGDIDQILDKVLKSGYGSLTAQEKKQLFDASKK